MDKNDIFTLIRSRRQAIREFGVKRVGLFGSYARNEQREGSDIDLLVEFEKGKKNFRQFIHLCFYLDNLLGKKVEVLTPEGLSPFLKPYIDKEVVYEELY